MVSVDQTVDLLTGFECPTIPPEAEIPRDTRKEANPYPPDLSRAVGKESCARFDGGRLSWDGGVVLPHEVERWLEFAAPLTRPNSANERNPAGKAHSLRRHEPVAIVR